MINDKVKALQVQARREKVKEEKIVISLTMKKMLGYDNISVGKSTENREINE